MVKFQPEHLETFLGFYVSFYVVEEILPTNSDLLPYNRKLILNIFFHCNWNYECNIFNHNLIIFKSF